jgi:hypothetical protein
MQDMDVGNEAAPRELQGELHIVLVRGRIATETDVPGVPEELEVTAGHLRAFAVLAARYAPSPANDLFQILQVNAAIQVARKNVAGLADVPMTTVNDLWLDRSWIGQLPDRIAVGI